MKIFWLNPFLYLLINLKKFKQPVFTKILMLVCLFFCLTFVIPNEYTDADTYRGYLVRFNQSSQSFSVFYDSIFNEFTDPLMPIITYLVSAFTVNYHILFLIYGVFYSFFFVKFYSRLIKYFNVSNNVLFFILLLFIIPIWQINGFRMWTATYAMIHGVFLIFERKLIGAISCLIFSSLMHVALSPFLIIILFYYTKKLLPLNALFFIYILTFFVEQINLSDFLKFDFLPEIFKIRAEGYSNDDFIIELNQAKQSTNFYIKYKVRFLFYPLFISLIYLYNKSKFVENYKYIELLKLFFIVLIIANFILSLKLGAVDRFYYILNLFMGLVVFFYLNYIKLPSLLYVFLKSVFILYLIVELRYGLDYVSFDFFISNPLIALLFHSEIPLIALIDFFK